MTTEEPTMSEAERQRAFGEVYAYLLSLAAKRRAESANQTPTK